VVQDSRETGAFFHEPGKQEARCTPVFREAISLQRTEWLTYIISSESA